MHRRSAVLGTFAAAVLAVSLAVPSAATPASPDPAPGGPAHQDEPEVEGPENLDTLDSTVRRDPGADRGVSVTFDRRSRTASGGKPAAPRRFVFLFDKSVTLHPDRFPTCSRETIEEHGFDACDPESVVGRGRAETYGQEAPAEVKIFNTRYENGHRGVLITVPATGGIFENTLEPVSAPYRSTYRWALDERLELNDTPPQERPASTRFMVEFGAQRTVHGKELDFAESSAPDRKPLDFGLWSRFVTGQVIIPTGRD